MCLISYFPSTPDASLLPQGFPNPFNNQPHALAKRAAEELKLRLADVEGGRMFGVLVVKDAEDRVGYLSAFAGQGALSGYVPPLSADAMLINRLGERQSVTHFFTHGQPPAGTGNCVAPKLLQYAYLNNLYPLALAEFWWGDSPAGEVRHHGYFYPACRSRCYPILPFMLKGLALQPQRLPPGEVYNEQAPATVYEDDELVVVNKPAGLLSVPGKEIEDSVMTRLQRRYPDVTGQLLVHRLDMSTSGLILAAKTPEAFKALQQQFEKRQVEKRYVALLSARLTEGMDDGVVDLPLRVDLDDRPRQLVCFEHGKPARTRWQVIVRHATTTRVYFYPETGRTHQLRVHAAHKDGLNAPIVGDELYGVEGERLLLHAERLCFTHPTTGRRVEVECQAPF